MPSYFMLSLVKFFFFSYFFRFIFCLTYFSIEIGFVSREHLVACEPCAIVQICLYKKKNKKNVFFHTRKICTGCNMRARRDAEIEPDF